MASTGPALSSTASRATTFEWMSDKTATRTDPAYRGRRASERSLPAPRPHRARPLMSPRIPASGGRVARPAVVDGASSLADEDEPMVGDRGQASPAIWIARSEGRVDHDPVAAERGDRSFGGLDLGAEAARVGRIPALPGEELPAGLEERQGELDEVGQAGNRPGGHEGPAAAMDGIPSDRLRPHADRPPSRGACEPLADDLEGGVEEPRLLADRLDQGDLAGGHRDGEGDRRETGAAADVEEAIDPERPHDVDRGEAVRDVADRDRRGIADRRQIDGLVPGEEQPDVIVDRGPRRWGEIDAEGRQRCVEGVFVRRWQIGEGLDARRERVTRAVQAPLLSVVPAGRPASAPGVVVRNTS